MFANFDPTRVDAAEREKLLSDLVRWSFGGIAGAHVTATSDIEINLLRQDGRLLLHLLNYRRAEDYDLNDPKGAPYLDVPVEVAVPSGTTIKRLFLIGPDIDGEKELAYEVRLEGDQDVAHLVIPRIDIYCLVVMEFE